MDRKKRILGPIRPAEMRGLEIGVLNNPTVRKSDGDVLYVDYASTEHLRTHQYSDTVRPEDICEVDIVWAEKPLSACVGSPVDYAVACHVIEHVPDTIGWLLDIHAALKVGGTIGLVIPDKRFTFDVKRPVSTAGQMIEAYLKKQRIPSIAQKFDFTSQWRKVDVNDAWKRDLSGDNSLAPVGPSANLVAYRQAEEILQTSRYMDSHCWIFTPQSFLETCSILAEIGLFPFVIDEFQTTMLNEFEFTVHLKTTTPTDPAVGTSINMASQKLQTSWTERLYRIASERKGSLSYTLLPILIGATSFGGRVRYNLAQRFSF